MPANLINSWTVGTLIAISLLIALILVTGPADRAAKFFARSRKLLFDWAFVLGTGIKKIWNLDGEKERQQERIEIRREAAFDKKMLEKRSLAARLPQNSNGYQNSTISQSLVVSDQNHAPAEDITLTEEEQKRIERRFPDVSANYPTIGIIANAWARRVIFLVLVLVCVGSDYVLVSSRAPILFGGGEPPSFLKAAFQYLQIITGVLFVSIAALSGMLIEEYSPGLSDSVRLEPDISSLGKKIKLILAIAMIVLDAIVVILLTTAGVNVQFGLPQELDVIYVVFIGTSLLVAIGIFLAWPGLTQAVFALGWLFIGGILALACLILGTICSVLAAIMSLLDALNERLWTLVSGRPQIERQERVEIERRSLAIVGFGSQGSNFAFGVCQQVYQMFGQFAWLSGLYMPNNVQSTKMERQLRQSRVAVESVSVDPNEKPENAANDLVLNIERQYTTKSDAVKPLVWVAAGKDLSVSLPALKQLGVKAGIQDIRIVLIWILPERFTKGLQETANALLEWWKEENSILATTVMIQEDSHLAATMGDRQYDVLYRSVASLLGAGRYNADADFPAVAMQQREAGFAFSALAAGSIGVVGSPSDFKTGLISGGKGEINPITSSETMKFLAEQAFDKNTLSTADFQLQATPFINIVVTERLKLAPEFQTAVSKWLQSKYGINQGKITVIPLSNPEDKGVNISGQIKQYKGDYYFHFTAFGGIVAVEEASDDTAQDRSDSYVSWSPPGRGSTQGGSAPTSPAHGNDMTNFA